MPVLRDSGGADSTILDTFGFPSPPPAPPTAQPTVGTAPTVSSTPTPSQGIATDQSGRLPVAVAAQSIPMTTSDPDSPKVGQVWYRTDTSQLSIRHDTATTKRVTLA